MLETTLTPPRPRPTATPLLELHSINAAYGKSPVLWGVDLEIKPGEAVALLGRNGVGKTTLLRTITGLHPLSSGTVHLDGQDVSRVAPHLRAQRGVAYVPQGRGIFPHLTITENLRMGLPALSSRKDAQKRIPDMVYDLFPILHEMRDRKGGNLSGGQQQQLALARALVTQPRLLLLDEPTEGIQPSIVQQIEEALFKVRTELGVAVLLVEQYLEFAWSFAERFYVLQRGKVVESGDTAEVASSAVERWLHV